jgi:hypothetical protein
VRARARPVILEPLQDAWLDAEDPAADGLLFEEWFGVELVHRLEQADWPRIAGFPVADLVLFHWPDAGRASGALGASVASRHHLRLATEGVWPP